MTSSAASKVDSTTMPPPAPPVDPTEAFQSVLAGFTSLMGATKPGADPTSQHPVTIKPQILEVGSVAIPPPASNPQPPAAPPAPGSALAEAELLSANWGAWGMHNGVNFADPPSSLPPDAQQCLHFFATNPTLFSAIVQDAGGQPGGVMTLASLNQYISDAKGDAATAQSAVPSETPGNPVITNVQMLVANWHTWGLHSVAQISNPPSDLPPDAQNCLNFIRSNPTLMNALVDGDSSGVITEAGSADFLKKASGDASAGAKAFSDWQAANPNAGAEATSLAQSASEILSNATLISGGSGNITAAELSSFASSPNIDPSLAGAAKMWAQPGMFKMLDTAGDDIATTQPDGVVNAANISAWISKAAPTSDLGFVNTLNQAALESSVAGIDTSKLGADVFANPQNYTGAQKAAVMVQLGDLQTKLAVGGQESYWDPGESILNETTDGINPNLSKVQADIQQHIDQLSQDPDVQAYIAQTKPTALQSIIQSDPSVSSAANSFYTNNIVTGQALNSDLALKDSSGNQVSPSVGLETFMQQASFYDAALGSGGTSLGIMNAPPGANGQPGTGMSLIQQAVKNSGQEGALQQDFTNEIVNGKMITDAVSGGTDLGTAISQYSAAAAAYGTALDPTFLAANAGAMQQNFLGSTSDAIMDSGSAADLAVAFGDSNGNFDAAKVTSILQQMQQQDPDLFKTSDGQDLTPDKIVNLVSQAYNLVRNGVKLGDALSKVMDSVTAPTGTAADLYKAGTLHLVSALFGGGVLAAKAAEGAHSPTADASIAATSAQMVGTLTEGVAKWGGSTAASLWQAGSSFPTPDGLPTDPTLNGVPPEVKATLKNIESQGKVLGGLGGALSGALSIVSGVGDLKAGDIAGGVLNIGSGSAGALAGVAGATEGGAALLSSAGLLSDGVTGIISAASSALGLFGTVVGVLGAVGYGIYEIVKSATAANDFTGQVLPVLQQYGITGGPIEPGDAGPDPNPGRSPNVHV